MRVGILGTRGIPNAYGGFEQFAQYLALGLVKRGHGVSVYNSSDHPYRDSQWNGIQIIHCRDWEPMIGTAGQFLYDYNCFRDAARRNFDILLQLGYTSSSIWHRLWPRNALNVVNMDGLEWKRSKYNWLTRQFLRRAESWAVEYGDVLIADSIAIREYIRQQYDKDAAFIAYGSEIPHEYDVGALKRLELTADGYWLLIARMEPENNIEMVIQGWMASPKGKPLVVVGNAGNSYGRYLTHTYSSEGLHFVGAIYDQPLLNSLRHFSSMYFHGHSVGGTNPSLLEAMACGCTIAAHDNNFNKAVLGSEAFYFSSAKQVNEILQAEKETGSSTAWRLTNTEKVISLYNWEKIINDYELVFNRQLKR